MTLLGCNRVLSVNSVTAKAQLNDCAKEVQSKEITKYICVLASPLQYLWIPPGLPDGHINGAYIHNKWTPMAINSNTSLLLTSPHFAHQLHFLVSTPV